MRRRRYAAVVVLIGMIAYVPAVLAASTVVLKCTDGANSIDIVGKSPVGASDIVCDADAAVDGGCAFVAVCPACRYGVRPCQAPCARTPRYLWAEVGVGHSQKLRLGSQLLVFRCGAAQHGQ
jgi:hypothetical protein